VCCSLTKWGQEIPIGHINFAASEVEYKFR
jgi:hypothetical protein